MAAGEDPNRLSVAVPRGAGDRGVCAANALIGRSSGRATRGGERGLLCCGGGGGGAERGELVLIIAATGLQ